MKKRTIFTPNEFVIKDKFVEIVLYNNKSIEVARTKIDHFDLFRVNTYKWRLHCSGYVVTCIRKKFISLHRFILSNKGKFIVDHIDHDPLNNCKHNLRLVTKFENNINRSRLNKNNNSGLRGVYWDKTTKKWRARIGVHGENKSIGSFHSVDEAIKVRKKAEGLFWGEEAKYANI